MPQPGHILHESDSHLCIQFHDLVSGAGVQANQFLIIRHGEGLLMEPGGQRVYPALLEAVRYYLPIDRLRYVFVSHQDPDIAACAGQWLDISQATLIASRLWSRFLPHFTGLKDYRDTLYERLLAVPDEGMRIGFGQDEIVLLPAHFLHSVGNLNLYDPLSGILFSGDIGASLSPQDANRPVDDLTLHSLYMKDFHQRYMSCGKILRLWAHMVRELQPRMIVPQHGGYFADPETIEAFLNWLETLRCGVDLMTQENYRIP